MPALQKNICPVCAGRSLELTVRRERIPTMQNYVYPDETKAQKSRQGEFNLCVCKNCGFAFNASFDAQLLTYDEGYDNNVPSAVFTSYYNDLAIYLKENYPIENGFVVDIGCGKGTFLKILSQNVKGMQGLGIDPSYEAPSTGTTDGLTFIKKTFEPDQLTKRPNLVLCRHVLEHIERPVAFLNQILEALKRFPDVPICIEVPDSEWIIDNKTFWDFCYEHCNYFTSDSLANVLELAGYKVTKSRKVFGTQYQWMEALSTNNPSKSLTHTKNIENLINKIKGYTVAEKKFIHKVHKELLVLRGQKTAVIIWGMATKGVLFANLLDPKKELIDACVDINTRKQGKYIPFTGHKISAPEELSKFKGKPCTVIVMNPNYANEIEGICSRLSLNVTLIDPTIWEITEGNINEKNTSNRR